MVSSSVKRAMSRKFWRRLV
jgi:hypothetical protein